MLRLVNDMPDRIALLTFFSGKTGPKFRSYQAIFPINRAGRLPGREYSDAAPATQLARQTLPEQK